MTKGILLVAYGLPAYGKYAFNLAHSIKHYSPNTLIHLICDNAAIAHIDISIFDGVELAEFGKDHCNNKINLYNISPFDKTLYLDVDAICLKEIDSLFEKLEGKKVYCQVIGQGGKGDKIDYSIWASNKTIWDHFKLKEDAILPGLQTSIIYFEKSKEAEKFYKKLAENYKNKLTEKEYTSMWGRSKQHPDELYYSVTMAQLGITDDDISPLYFPHSIEKTKNIIANHYILSMYGAFNLVRPYAHDLYNSVIGNILYSQHKHHLYKSENLYKNKFAVNR